MLSDKKNDRVDSLAWGIFLVVVVLLISPMVFLISANANKAIQVCQDSGGWMINSIS